MAEKRNHAPDSSNALENVRISASKPQLIDVEFNMPKVRVKEVDNTCKSFRCCMCGNTYTTQKGNFLSGGNSPLWKGNNGYIPFCKSCTESLMDSYTHLYSGNEEHALKHLCQMFDWYYCDTASAMTLAQVHLGKSRVTLYPSKTVTRQVATMGETFVDTMKDDQENRNKYISYTTNEDGVENDDDEFVVTKEMVHTWGAGYTPSQYRYLEEEYNDWIAKNVCNTKSQEEIYRNIAIAQLDVRLARERGGKVSDAQDALQKLMNSANILPKQTAENVLADTQTFGTLLKKYEETRPIPEPAPEWRDVDGIRTYMNTWYRGGLAKSLHIKNDNAALYDDAVHEMDRYTVKRTDTDQSADGLGAAIFDDQQQNGGDKDGETG